MKTIGLIIALFLIFGDNKEKAKCEDKNIKKDTMEYFDVEKFKENNPKNKQKKFVLPNGNLVKQFDAYNGKVFVERVRIINTPLEQYREYYSDGKIKVKSELFYSFQKGIRLEYNEQGCLIKEIDNDKPYKFSVDDLVKKMQSEYHVDIMNPLNVFRVSRYVSVELSGIPIYEVCIKDRINSRQLECYLINANTGETLYFIERFSGDKKGSLIQNYLNSLK